MRTSNNRFQEKILGIFINEEKHKIRKVTTVNVVSAKCINDRNFLKPIHEVSEEIQRRKSVHRNSASSSVWEF